MQNGVLSVSKYKTCLVEIVFEDYMAFSIFSGSSLFFKKRSFSILDYSLLSIAIQHSENAVLYNFCQSAVTLSAAEAHPDEDWGSPCPDDADDFDGRPKAEETEGAISKFITGLKGKELAGFEKLHTLLSKLHVPVANPGSKMSHVLHWTVVLFPKWTRNSRKGSLHLSSCCTSTQWNTGT
jgi:hypothetical protein